jgi:hypothetical protein
VFLLACKDTFSLRTIATLRFIVQGWTALKTSVPRKETAASRVSSVGTIFAVAAVVAGLAASVLFMVKKTR